ncbi:META domain-containing protein [Falsiroseomonas sp.]|uniref:META domain-containing protein n=1 Tax=Falsiroseomonas sp. TaxID=2870721 RepID=UPI0034A312A2
MRRAALALLLLAPLPAVAQSPLAGTSWELVELRSPDDSIGTVRVDDPARYTITFNADGSAALRLDCNRGRGSWRSEAPGRIAFGAVATTRMMCPPGSLDARLGREIPFLRVYALEGDRLRLELTADGGQQIWRRAQP